MSNINLQQLGLTKTESKVYLSLLQIGSTTTGPLVKKTELHRATVYDVLKRLMEKGLVTYITKEKTKHFQTTDPRHFIDMIHEEKEELDQREIITKNIVRDINKIKKHSKNKENASIYQGIRGIKTILEDVLTYKKYYVFTSKGKFKEILGSYFFQFQNKKKIKKIQSKLLVDESLRNSEYSKAVYGKIKYLPKEYSYPTGTFVYGEKVALFVFTDYPTGILIESKEISDSFKSYFKILWKIAKK